MLTRTADTRHTTHVARRVGRFVAATPANNYTQVIDDCAAPGLEVVSVTHLFPVGAGRHAVGLVLAKRSGTIDPVVSSRDIAVVYINQNSIGAS